MWEKSVSKDENGYFKTMDGSMSGFQKDARGLYRKRRYLKTEKPRLG